MEVEQLWDALSLWWPKRKKKKTPTTQDSWRQQTNASCHFCVLHITWLFWHAGYFYALVTEMLLRKITLLIVHRSWLTLVFITGGFYLNPWPWKCSLYTLASGKHSKLSSAEEMWAGNVINPLDSFEQVVAKLHVLQEQLHACKDDCTLQ